MSRLITGVNARHATVRLQSQLCLAVFQVLLPRVFPFRVVVFVDIVEREQVRIVAHHQFVQVDSELARSVLSCPLELAPHTRKRNRPTGLFPIRCARCLLAVLGISGAVRQSIAAAGRRPPTSFPRGNPPLRNKPSLHVD